MPDQAQTVNPWTRLRQLQRTLGPLDGLLYVISRVLERLSGGRVRIVRFRLVAQPIGSGAAPVVRPDASTVVAATPAGSPLVGAFPRPPEVIRARYAGGAECFSAVVRSAFAGYIWFRRGSYDEDVVRCRYVLAAPDCSVWDFDVYVEPRYRLGRTMARLWHAVDSHLAGQGVRWSFSRISTFNPGSLAAHARLNTVDCGSATFLCLGPLQLSLLSAAPFVHLSLSDQQRPSIRLAPPT